MICDIVECLGLTPHGYLGLGAGGNRPFGFHLWEKPVEWDETPHEAGRRLATTMLGQAMALDDTVEIGMRMRNEQERVFTFAVAVQPDAMHRVARGVQWLSFATARASGTGWCGAVGTLGAADLNGWESGRFILRR